MAEQNILPFPYEFKEIQDEEKAEIRSIYTSANADDLLRVGPKGFIVYRRYKEEAENIYNMPLRPSDVFVASYQRSGTTWTQELIWLLANDLDYETAEVVPLAHRYPFLDMFMFFSNDVEAQFGSFGSNKEKILEIANILATPATRILATAPLTSPRFVKTHLPMSLLPPKLLDTAKMVYVARDPRDVAVSCYHHAKLFTIAGLTGSFKEFWNTFYKGIFTLTPYFEHVKEAWEMRHHPNMLFLFYEELSKDLPVAINCAADFLGKDLNEEQMARLCDHLSIESFRTNKSVNYEEMREFGLLAPEETFVRKGKTGGWRGYFDEEMTQQAERWIEDNLRNTDLRFPNAN